MLYKHIITWKMVCLKTALARLCVLAATDVDSGPKMNKTKKAKTSFCFHSAHGSFVYTCFGTIQFVYVQRHAKRSVRSSINAYTRMWVNVLLTLHTNDIDTCICVFSISLALSRERLYECAAYITLICAHLVQLTAFQVVLFISLVSEDK